jgi:hypothetical protein
MYMVACASAWVHPEQQFEECCVDFYTGWCQTACCPQIIVRCNSQMKKKQIDPEVGLGFLFMS